MPLENSLPSFEFICDGLYINVLWFRKAYYKKDWLIAKHRHSSFEFHILSQGACRVWLDHGRGFTATSGDFYLTAPGIDHEQLWCGKANAELSLHCDIRLLGAAPPHARALYRVLSHAACFLQADQKGISALFELVLAEFSEKQLNYRENIQHLIFTILSRSAQLLDGGNSAGPAPHGREKERFLQIERFVADNLCNPIRSRDVAQFLYISQRQLCRIVQREAGCTLQDYIHDQKLKKAKELLAYTDLPVAEISDRLGFSSAYYFSQFFKRIARISPSQYRSIQMSGNHKESSR